MIEWLATYLENPGKFLRNMHRHLVPGGVIIVSTPNPFFMAYGTMRDMRRDRFFMCNLEHVCWITPFSTRVA